MLRVRDEEISPAAMRRLDARQHASHGIPLAVSWQLRLHVQWQA
jgi:hypothetical protein